MALTFCFAKIKIQCSFHDLFVGGGRTEGNTNTNTSSNLRELSMKNIKINTELCLNHQTLKIYKFPFTYFHWVFFTDFFFFLVLKISGGYKFSGEKVIL